MQMKDTFLKLREIINRHSSVLAAPSGAHGAWRTMRTQTRALGLQHYGQIFVLRLTLRSLRLWARTPPPDFLKAIVNALLLIRP